MEWLFTYLPHSPAAIVFKYGCSGPLVEYWIRTSYLFCCILTCICYFWYLFSIRLTIIVWKTVWMYAAESPRSRSLFIRNILWLQSESMLLCSWSVTLHKVLIDDHCLHHLPSVKTPSIQLRPASHNCQLPICKYVLYKRSFLVHCLFNCH